MSLTSKGLQDGYIYVIELGFDGLYKIGCTRKLKSRMRALSSANPRLKIVMAYQVLGMKKVERFLHKRFSILHHSKELFRLESANLSWVKEYLQDENKRFLQAKNGTCPKCGNHMVLRKNKKNGNKFYGCSRYPTCNQTISLVRMGNLTLHAPDKGYAPAKIDLSTLEADTAKENEHTPAPCG